MCEAIVLSNRSKKGLFIPKMSKKTNFRRENPIFAGNKAAVVDFSVKQTVAG